MVGLIVVGAGSSGAAVAARLARAGRDVLLLEAGPDHDAGATPHEISGPNFFAACSLADRIWPSLVSTHADGQAPKLYLRGRGVGGSSAVNAGLGVIAPADDYERWAHEHGCGPRWGWASISKALARVHEVIPLEEIPRPAWGAASTALLAESPSARPGRFTRCDGRRISTNEAYLEPLRGRHGLEVRGDAHVERVLFDGRRATGVRLADGTELEAGEVILAAGSIHTPAIVLRSGIEGAVGRNLADHPSVGVTLVLRGEARFPSPDSAPIAAYAPYSSHLADARDDDMQLLPIDLVGSAADATAYARLQVACMQVWSRGEVRLASADPLIEPVVEQRMLSDERDLIRLRDGIRRVVTLVEQPAFRAISITVAIDDVGTPVSVLSDMDDDALDAWLMAHVGDYVHAVGTCRMGPADDPRSVVDPELRVIGHDRLRVADASIMPEVPRANTHLTAVAIGELAADIVLEM